MFSLERPSILLMRTESTYVFDRKSVGDREVSVIGLSRKDEIQRRVLQSQRAREDLLKVFDEEEADTTSPDAGQMGTA
jgi:hypothetical protein